ncbi:PTS sugar transporter subunit IIB [Bombilactobacillus thymidiniphilus]|uniref:PTS sugar transporter subunit IIB n=1 Tax=Bombilactobacillus thymidiniphilus TaxID=2923363 RepID=A0ABY4PCW0_9LACO|nr:PTS sugar transporter subunit IIB [Bombilactobacillus thymidiniphilus]UQS83430.1 PTS sugar transporter subunit IIB [Bombilactobacillus thymidiniphilus]
MIKLVRVDHRLLHGQVAVSWFNTLGANTILIVNDAVAGDELRKSAIRLAKPEHAKLVMKSVADSIASINSGITDKYDMLVVVENVADAKRLIQGTEGLITDLNLGGTKPRANTKSYAKTINLSEQEVQQLTDLQNLGVQVYIQQVPSETRQVFKA